MISRHQRNGFALPAVIFMMVIVALLIMYMSRLLTTEAAAGNIALLGARAYWAAQSANEWAAYEINRTDACPTAPAGFTITGFSIVFNCTATPYLEGANAGVIFEVSSRAVYGSSPAEADYVSRTLEMVLDVQ